MICQTLAAFNFNTFYVFMFDVSTWQACSVGDSLVSNIKDFRFTTRRVGEQSLGSYWCQDEEATERQECVVYKMLPSAGEGLTLEWPQRVLHPACLAAKHVHALAVNYKPAIALPDTHAAKHSKTCIQSFTETADTHTNIHVIVAGATQSTGSL